MEGRDWPCFWLERLRKVTKEIRTSSLRKHTWTWDLLNTKEGYALELSSQRQARRIPKSVYDIQENSNKNSSVKDGKEMCVVITELGLYALGPMVNGRMPQGLSFSSRSVENAVLYFPRHSSGRYYTNMWKIWGNCIYKYRLLQTLRRIFIFPINLLPKNTTLSFFLSRTFPYQGKSNT